MEQQPQGLDKPGQVSGYNRYDGFSVFFKHCRARQRLVNKDSGGKTGGVKK